MGDVDQLAAVRARLSTAGLGAADIEWLDRCGWADAAIPPIESDAQRADYARREAALNAASGHLTFAERAVTIEAKLAAAIGARIADWDERGEDNG
jgi:hypothetical protein